MSFSLWLGISGWIVSGILVWGWVNYYSYKNKSRNYSLRWLIIPIFLFSGPISITSIMLIAANPSNNFEFCIGLRFR
ncbi:MAG TPA: hypothetical protein PK367_01255 [Candidatus Paceibacterota bacterium]|nr:hypothetical protein [Candidatus Paceibacterota bacterium]